MKLSCHCGVIIVFDVKYVALESVNDSISCLSYIFNMTPVAFQAMYKVIAVASALSYCIVGFVVV